MEIPHAFLNSSDRSQSAKKNKHSLNLQQPSPNKGGAHLFAGESSFIQTAVINTLHFKQKQHFNAMNITKKNKMHLLDSFTSRATEDFIMPQLF